MMCFCIVAMMILLSDVPLVSIEKGAVFASMSLLKRADVKPLGYLPWQVDCKKIRWHEKRFKAAFGGKAYCKFKYTLQLKLGSASMELLALYRGKTAGIVEMPYEGTEEIPQTEDEISGLEFKCVRFLVLMLNITSNFTAGN